MIPRVRVGPPSGIERYCRWGAVTKEIQFEMTSFQYVQLHIYSNVFIHIKLVLKRTGYKAMCKLISAKDVRN